MTTLEYYGVKVHFGKPTGRARLKLTELRSLVGYWDLTGQEQIDIGTATNMLYLVESVDGDLGFPVPVNGDASADSIRAFAEGILNAHESLYIEWANKVAEARTAGSNDPDLLPPGALTDSQKKAPKSNKSDSNKT